MIATIAPAGHRCRAIEAIVALQVMYDYLDALTEQPTADPIRDGLRHMQAFSDAVTISGDGSTVYLARGQAASNDGGYLAALARTVRGAITCLPAFEAIADTIPCTVARCAEAQVRIHAVPLAGERQLEGWAQEQARVTELQWREWLFGAMGSVVAAHALIALAADEQATIEQARELDEVYLELCVLTTALDHLVDYERDVRSGEHSYTHLYATRTELADAITIIIDRVSKRAHAIPNGAHHLMILSGVVAYYTSQPGAMGEFAKPVTECVQDQLRPLITPTLASMHVWRMTKNARSRLHVHRVRM